MEQLSGVAIIICIAFGFTTFVLFFIFGKRQIMRFALKSRRGPHIPVAADAPKYLRKEIERRQEIVKEIKLEPRLVSIEEADHAGDKPEFEHEYRMRSVDELVKLEQAILEASSEAEPRPPSQDLKFYLQRMARDRLPLAGCDPNQITDFVDLYNHARHEPMPVYGEAEHKRYMELITALIEHVHKRNAPPPRVDAGSKSSMQKSKTTAAALNGRGRATVRIVTPSEEDRESESSV